MADTSDQSDWKNLVTTAASIATLGSALIYGLIALGYTEFYRELGLTPQEVGIEAGKTVGDAVGLAVVLTVVSFVAALAVYVVARLIARSDRFKRLAEKPSWTQRFAAEAKLKQFTWMFGGAAVLVFLVAGTALRELANTRADDVKKGRPVEPLRIGPGLFDFVPLEVLAVHADPVMGIASARPAEDVPQELTDAQKRGDLFYLGRSAGSAVLYDARKQHNLVLPTASLVLELSNCETRFNRDQACKAHR